MAEIQLNKGSKLDSETGECSNGLELAIANSIIYNQEGTKVDQNEEISRFAQEFEAFDLDKETQILELDNETKIVELDKEAKILEFDKKAKILELDKKVEKIKLKKDGKFEIPTLVVEIFLKWLIDVELLKTCRLVNQYWNGLACSSLRNHSIVNLDVSSLLEFRKCKRSRAKIRNGVAVPRPFKNFHVSICGSTIDTFSDLACRNKNVITSVKLYGIPVKNGEMEKINKFLLEAMKSLTSLYIDSESEYILGALCDVKCPGLTNLKIQLPCLEKSACDHFDVIVKSLENSYLQQLTLDLRVSSHSSCLPSLLKINLSHVVELDLEIVEKGKNEHFWKLLPELKLPSLKTFRFINDRIFDEEVQPLVSAFLSNVALSLVSLHINYRIQQPQWRIRFGGVDYANLKFLLVVCPNDFSVGVTAKRFPSLQMLGLVVTQVEQIKFLPNAPDFLGGVEKLHIFIDTMNPEGLGLLFPQWVAGLISRFPNVVDFAVIDRRKQLRVSSWFLDVLQVYRNLKALHVEASIDLREFNTTSLSELMEYNRTQLQYLPQRPSLLIFEKLEELVWISELPQISNDTFILCLTYLTTLKYLEFAWNHSLSVRTVATYIKYLGGLRRLNIRFRLWDSIAEDTVKQLEESFADCQNLTVVYEKRVW